MEVQVGPGGGRGRRQRRVVELVGAVATVRVAEAGLEGVAPDVDDVGWDLDRVVTDAPGDGDTPLVVVVVVVVAVPADDNVLWQSARIRIDCAGDERIARIDQVGDLGRAERDADVDVRLGRLIAGQRPGVNVSSIRSHREGVCAIGGGRGRIGEGAVVPVVADAPIPAVVLEGGVVDGDTRQRQARRLVVGRDAGDGAHRIHREDGQRVVLDGAHSDLKLRAGGASPPAGRVSGLHGNHPSVGHGIDGEVTGRVGDRRQRVAVRVEVVITAIAVLGAVVVAVVRGVRVEGLVQPEHREPCDRVAGAVHELSIEVRPVEVDEIDSRGCHTSDNGNRLAPRRRVAARRGDRY